MTTKLQYYKSGLRTVKQLRAVIHAAYELALMPHIYVRASSFRDVETDDLIFPHGWERVSNVGYKFIVFPDIDGHTALAAPMDTFDVKIEYNDTI